MAFAPACATASFFNASTRELTATAPRCRPALCARQARMVQAPEPDVPSRSNSGSGATERKVANRAEKKRGLIRTATHYAARVEPANTPAVVWREINRDLVSVAERGSAEDAVELLAHLVEQGRAVSQNFNQVVSILVDADNGDMALQLAEDAAACNLATGATFRPLLLDCCRRNALGELGHIRSLMKSLGVQTDSHAVTQMITTHFRNRQAFVAEALLEEQELAGSANIFMYNALMRGYSKAGLPSKALSVLSRMRDFDVDPDEASYTAVLNACAKKRDLKTAGMVAKEMLKAEMAPGVSTYNALIKCYAKERQFDQVLALFEDMKRDVTPNVVTYNLLIDACAQTDNTAYASEIFDEMLQAGVEYDIVTLTSLIKVFGRARNSKRAVELFRAMRNGSLQVDEKAFQAVIKACLLDSNASTALDIISEALEDGQVVTEQTWAWFFEVALWKGDESLAVRGTALMGETNVRLSQTTVSKILSEVRELGVGSRFASAISKME